MLLGYLTGLIIGFTMFDPDTDVYALLGAILALLGVIIGVIPFFSQRVNIVFGVLVGFYLGMIIAILLWGKPETDDLLEFIKAGWNSIFTALVISIMGGYIASRLDFSHFYLPAFALLVGGFLGGAFFVTFGLAPTTMVGVSPFVIGSGLVSALTLWFLVKRLSPKSSNI